MVLVKHGRTQKYKRQWHHRRHLINATPTQFIWQLVRFPNNGASQQRDNRQLWRHKTCTSNNIGLTSQHAGDTRVRNRENHTHIKMNNVEYMCTSCHENFITEQSYLNHKAQNHLGQRWKCHACDRYFVRRLDRSLHIVVVHPNEPRSTSEKSDFVGGLRPPRKTCRTETTVQEVSP